MAQSSRGALETWRESSALLAVFCSTAESPGPQSSLANCCVPPRALCAIKDNCANDVRRGNASPLRQTEVNSCSSRKCTRRHILTEMSVGRGLFCIKRAAAKLIHNSRIFFQSSMQMPGGLGAKCAAREERNWVGKLSRKRRGKG